MMLRLLNSELLKKRHTFSLKLVIVSPFITLILGYILSGNSVQLTGYNWWYIIMLPISLSIWCASSVSNEKRSGYQNLLCIPIKLQTIWISKVLSVMVLLLTSCLLIWGLCSIFGAFTVMHISVINGFIGSLLLFLTFIWQIPLIIIVAKKFGYLFAVLGSFGCNIILSMIGTTSSWFLCNPFSIPARVVCPFFGIQPNGLPIENGSILLETNLILPAVAINIVLFGLTLYLLKFSKRMVG